MADYVSTLASLSLPDMIYRSNNFKRNLYAYQRQWTSYWIEITLSNVLRQAHQVDLFLHLYQVQTDAKKKNSDTSERVSFDTLCLCPLKLKWL